MGENCQSLRVLSTKFVNLLKSNGGILDLRVAKEILQVKNMQRICDIIGVLEGMEMLERKSKNFVQWKTPSSDYAQAAMNYSTQMMKLRNKMAKLEKYERELDIRRALMQQNTKNTTKDSDKENLLYVTREDLNGAFQNKNVYIINTPIDKTDIKLTHSNGEYTLHVTSQLPIEAHLLHGQTETQEPEDSQNAVPPALSVNEALPESQEFAYSLPESEGSFDLFNILE